MKKRILSLLLAFTLCLTLQPTSAFAQDADGCVSSEITTVEDSQSTATGAPNESGGQSNNDVTGEQSGSETDARMEGDGTIDPAATTNYNADISNVGELTVGENAADVASVTTTDGTKTTYSSFSDAWAAVIASEGSTLKLLDNVNIGDTNDGLSANSGKFTLDLDGKTLSGSAYLQLIDVSGTVDITIQNGKLTNIFSKDGSDINPGLANVVDITGGKITLENVDVTSGRGYGGAHTYAVHARGGSLTVTSGTFTGAIVVFSDSTGVHSALKITAATLHNGIMYVYQGSSTFDYAGVNALFADGSMLFDKDGNYIDITKAEYWISEDDGEYSVIGFVYSEDSMVKPHTHALVDGKCECGYICNHKNADGSSAVGADSKCAVCGTEVCEQGCIAHATVPDSTYIWHFKTLQELVSEIGGNSWLYMSYSSVTVKFLTDVTVTETITFNKCSTHIILDLDGHTISGKLDTDPVIDTNFVYGAGISGDGIYVRHCIAIQNGTIENTGAGAALKLSNGATTLKNVDVNGDMVLTYDFIVNGNYIPTFLGGGSFTKIRTENEDDMWIKRLENMLDKGCYFVDSNGVRIDADTKLSAQNSLVAVQCRMCNHKDADGKFTLTMKSYENFGSVMRCTICGNACTHDEITDGASPTCVACGLPIVAIAANRVNNENYGPYYYASFDTAMHDLLEVFKGICPTITLLVDTESSSGYKWSKTTDQGITIDLAGHDLTLENNSATGKVTIRNTSDTHAKVIGTVNVYTDSINTATLIVPEMNNNLTIEKIEVGENSTASLAGGSFGSIEIGEGSSKKLTDLLASEYYFTDTTSGEPVVMYDADGNAITRITNVMVTKCSHDEVVYVPVDGGAWKCFCGQKTFTASVTKDGVTTYFDDLQKAFDSADGGTVKLLASMVDVTVDTGKPFILDLNGCDLYSLTVNSKITLRDSGEKKGKIIEWLRTPAGMTIGDLLEEGYAFKRSDGTWPDESSKAVGGVSIQQAPITSVGLIALNADRTDASTTMAYGTTKGIKLSASCNLLNLTQTDCKWYKLGGTVIPIEDATGMNYFLPDDLTAGTHTYRVTFTSDGYSKSAEITITVTPISIEGAVVTVKNPTYNGAAQTPAVTVKLGNKTLTENKDYIVTAMEQTDAGSYQLSVRGKGGYEGEIENVEWKIEPIQLLGYCDIQSLTKTYDGTVAAPLTKSNLTFHAENGAAVTLPEDAYDITNARFTMRQNDGTYVDSPDAGNGKSLSYTLTLKSGNYVFKNNPQGRTTVCDISTEDVNKFTITQDSISLSNIQFTQVVFNNLAKSYEIELKTLLDNILSQQHRGCEYGEITYGLPRIKMATEYYDIDNGAKIKNDKLILPIKAVSSQNGEIGNVTIEVETTNYQTFDLVLQVIAQDKIVPVLATDSTIRATDITYGQTLNESMIKITGKMICPRTGNEIKGTFTWTNPETRFDAVGSFNASWTFTPDASFAEYAAATGIVTVTVNKNVQYGKVSMAGYTYGETPTTPTLAERTGDMNASVTYYYADGNTVKEWNISTPPALNPGTYRMIAKIDETDNYYGYSTAYCEFVVAKATPTYTKPTGLHATYGQTLADVKLPDGWTWMNSIESVGNATAGAKSFRAKFTPENTDNYNTVENIELEVTVNKADGNNLKTTEVMRRYTDTADHTYTPDWSGLPDGQIWRYSSEYSVSDGSTATLTKQDIAAVDGKLTYAISGGKDGDVVTITIKASCGNYEDFTIVLNINLATKGDQEALVITGNTTMVYGEKLTLTTDGGSGTGAVTYSIDNTASTGAATIDPNTGVLTPVRVGSVHVIATKAGDNDYNEVTSASFVLIIKPATPTGEPKYTEITTGDKTLKDAALTIEGSTLKPNAGKLEWVDDKGSVLPDDTRVEENTTYKWRFTPEDGNYTSLTGEIELYHVSAGDDYSYNTIVDAPQTGDSGQMHTITGAPTTGDDSRILLWITLLLVSGFGVIGAAIYGKGKKNSK